MVALSSSRYFSGRLAGRGFGFLATFSTAS
jgi:hypothetical protein